MQRSGSGRLRNTGNDHGPGRSASVALIFWQCPLWRPRAGRNDEQFYTLPARGESLKRFEKCDQGRKVLFSHVHRLHSAVCHCVGGLVQNAPQLCGVMLLSNSEQ